MTKATTPDTESGGTGPATEHVETGGRTKTTSGWIGVLLVLLLLTEQTGLAATLFAPALPQLGAEFSTSDVVWILSLVTLVGAVVTPLAGKLGDVYGKKRVLVALGCVATVGALISALAQSFGILLVGRALSGTAIAFLPLGYSLIRDIFPQRLSGLAIAIATNGLGLITVAGPLLAGWLIDDHGVRSIFWLMFGVSLLGALLTAFLVPESPLRARVSIDWLGAALLGGAIGALLLAINQGSAWGWTSATTIIVLLIAVGLALLWLRWERRIAEPLIRLDLLRDRTVMAVVLAGGAAMAVIGGIAAIFPTMLQTPGAVGPGYGLGRSVTEVAFHTMLGGTLLVASGVVVGLTARRVPPRTYVIVGATSLVAAAVFFAFFHSSSWMYITAYALMGIGGLVLAAGPIIMVNAVPAGERGVGAAMFGTSTQVCNTLGTQIVFAIMAAHFLPATGAGMPGYDADWFTLAFLVVAAIGVVGIAAGIAIPRAVRRGRATDPAAGPLAEAAA